jgi:hypothetical protein
MIAIGIMSGLYVRRQFIPFSLNAVPARGMQEAIVEPHSYSPVACLLLEGPLLRRLLFPP